MALLPDGLVMRPITRPEIPMFAAAVERTFGGSRLSDAEIGNRRGVLGRAQQAVRPTARVPCGKGPSR